MSLARRKRLRLLRRVGLTLALIAPVLLLQLAAIVLLRHADAGSFGVLGVIGTSVAAGAWIMSKSFYAGESRVGWWIALIVAPDISLLVLAWIASDTFELHRRTHAVG